MKIKIIAALTLCFIGVNALAQINYQAPGRSLTINSKDDKVKMKFSFRVQSLFSFENDVDAPVEDASMQAMIRRMRLKSNGHIYDPKFEYKLEMAFSQRDMSSSKDYDQVGKASKVVLDAVLKYHLNDKNQVWFGQTKLPGNRERVISSRDLQFVDRSLVNSRYNIDRDFGVHLRSKKKIGEMPVNLALAVTNGEGRNIRGDNEKSGLAYTGRVEVYPLGKFSHKKSSYYSADLKGEEKPKLAVGVTYSSNQNTNRNGQVGNFITDTAGNVFNTINTAFIDAVFKYKGLSVATEYANKQLAEAKTGFSQGTGFVVQSGYMLKNNYEISGRYTDINLQKGLAASVNTTEYTLGFSKYVVGHMLKWQTDVSFVQTEGGQDSYRFRFQFEYGI